MTKELEEKEVSKVFSNLNHINVNEHTKNKNGLTYLSWAWAWGEVKKEYPLADYEIKKFGEEEKPYLFDKDLGYMVFTTVTIQGLTHEMWLPVMDNRNNAMTDHTQKITKFKKEVTVQKATMFDINSAIMRCLTKNLAMHGLGLYIYAGEDLPQEPPAKKVNKTQVKAIDSVVKSIAKLINQTPAQALKTMLEHQNLPNKVEELNENQYGEFLHYMNGLKSDLEKKAQQAKKKDEVEADGEQDSLFEGNSTKPK